jgi:hypothetical protein
MPRNMEAVSLVPAWPGKWTCLHHSTFILCLHASTCGSTFCKADRNTGSCSRAIDVCPAQLVCVRSCSRLWWPWSITRNMRETVASAQSLGVPSVCVRFTLQGWNSIQESSVSRGDWDCLSLLPHRVRSVTNDGTIMMDDNLYLACLV